MSVVEFLLWMLKTVFFVGIGWYSWSFMKVLWTDIKLWLEEREARDRVKHLREKIGQ